MSSNDDRRSRIIEAMGQAHRADDNCRTMFSAPDEYLPRGEIPFEALFLAHYRSIREFARREAPGAAVIGVHAPTGRLAGRLWVGRRDSEGGSPRAAIIGRHSNCDLILDRPEVSLRHLALIVPCAGAPLRFSLHELRTGSGLRDSLGQPMGGAHVRGAGFFATGSYALFCMATGAPDRWPELASEAWRQVTGATTPLRIVGPQERSMDHHVQVDLRTSVTAIRGPVHTSARLLASGESRVCTLAISSEAGRARLALGDDALERGLLLGRYARCDGGIWRAESISRIHVLVLRVDGEVFAFDTASTNGVYTDPMSTEEARVVNLSRGARLVLGDGAGSVRIVS